MNPINGDSPTTYRTVKQPNYRRYWLSLYRRDPAAAERIVNDALHHWSPQRIYLRLFEPALNLSGTLWERGAITHYDEHFVTYHTLRFMRRVRRRFVPTETFGPLAVATGIVQDSHQIGLRMVCDFLGWANWRIHWLSSNDRATVNQVVERLQPDAVLMSIGLDSGVVHTGRVIADLRRRGYRGLIAIGGRVVNGDPGIVERVGADLTAPNGAALVRTLRTKLHAKNRSRLADRCDVGCQPNR